MQDFKKLEVYQRSYSLSIAICNDIKANRNQRIREQLMGSITSIPANLCEFAGMESLAQKKEKLRTCIREANESEHWLDTFRDISEMSIEKHKDYTEQLITIRKMLIGLLRSISPDDLSNKQN